MLAGKRAFIAGVADDNGYGWAIAKSLAAAGAEILVGTWVPVCKPSKIYSPITNNRRHTQVLSKLNSFRLNVSFSAGTEHF